jgi:hypothetical protein
MESDQHQYFPMMLFEGETGMPLGAWLRHGTAPAGLGAVDMIRRITGGTNIRYVVTNMSGQPGEIYRDFNVQRGNVPERPIGELKNGLHMDRLSSFPFCSSNSSSRECSGIGQPGAVSEGPRR